MKTDAYATLARMPSRGDGRREPLSLRRSFRCTLAGRLLVTHDCNAMWVKHSSYLADALSTTPPYLNSKEYQLGLVTDFRDLQVTTGSVIYRNNEHDYVYDRPISSVHAVFIVESSGLREWLEAA